MNFYRCPVFNHLAEGLDACSEWNAANTGLSREWRPEGAPTTDEVLIVLPHTKYIPVVEVRVVFCPLQKNITEQCIKFMVILSSTIVRKSNQHLQTNEELGTSFQLEMISQFFLREVAESQVSIVSMISVVNRMGFRCISGFFDHENKLTTCDSYLGDLCSIWIICALWNTNREVELEVELFQ